MKKKVINLLKYVLVLGIAGLLLWFALKGQDINMVKDQIRHANFNWIILSLLIGLVSHVSRSLRWKMLIKPLGYNPRFINIFFAVFIGYFANLAVPRLGEVSKCGVLKKYEKIPINKLLGTMIVERAIDLLSLAICVAILIAFEFGRLSEFFKTRILEGELLSKFENNGLLITLALTGLVLIIGLFIILYKKFKHIKFFVKIRDLVMGMWEGIKSVKNVQNIPLFIFHSVFIWVLYFLMTYVALFSIEGTYDLDPIAGFATFVFGSFGMAAPVQGGIGAYHWLVIETLQYFDVAKSSAKSFAILMHGSQTFMIIIFGFISLILLPFINKSKNGKEGIASDREKNIQPN